MEIINLIKYWHKRPLLLAFLTASLFILFALLIYTPTYEINDDVFLNLITNGYYTGVHSPYVFNMSAFAGFYLVILYRIIPSINWYGVNMYVGIWISLVTVLYSIFRYSKSWFSLIAYLCFTVIFYLHFVTSITFTFTAVLLAVSGLIFIIQAQYSSSSGKKILYLLSFITIVLSNLVRRGSLDLVFSLSIPAIITLIICYRKNRTTLIAFILISALVVFCLRQLNLKLYPTTPAWNKTMVAMVDFADCYYSPVFCQYDTQVEAYRQAGWSKNDYQMIMNFYYDDENIFSNSKASVLKDNIHIQNSFAIAIKYVGYRVLVIILLSFLFLQTIILAYAIVAGELHKRQKIMIVASAIMSLIYICFFAFRGYLPLRFAVAILFFLGTLTITPIKADKNESTNNPSSLRYVLTVFLVLFTLVLAVIHVRDSQSNDKHLRQFKYMYSSLPKGKQDVTLIWGSSLPYEWQNPLEDPAYIKERNIIIGAWTQRSVYNDMIKEKFHIKNMFTDLYTNPHLYLVANDYQQKLLEIFMQEHYGLKITYDTLKDFDQYGFSSKLLKVRLSQR